MEASSHSNDSAGQSVTIRRVGDDDRHALMLLAGRDTRPLPPEPLVAAEVDGRIAAVTSLVTGETIADPFAPTAELRAMLELRSAQLRRAGRRRARGRRLLLGRRSRASLAGSPPGAGGRLLSLESR